MNSGGQNLWNAFCLFTKHWRFISRWEIYSRKKIRHSIPWANNTIWRYFIIQFPQKTSTGCITSAQKTSEVFLFGYALNAGERLGGRPTRGRCGRIEWQHCIRSRRQKIQRKKKLGEQFIFSVCHRFITKMFGIWSESSYHQPEVHLIRFWLKAWVDVFSGKMMDQILRGTERGYGSETWFLEHLWKLHLQTLCQEPGRIISASRRIISILDWIHEIHRSE